MKEAFNKIYNNIANFKISNLSKSARITLYGIIVLLIIFAVQIPKYRYGFFTVCNEEYPSTNYLRLDNENILSVRLEQDIDSSWMIYNIKTNSFKKLNINIDFHYRPETVTIDKDRILLTAVNDKSRDDLYNKENSMAILNLKTAKIEKIIDRKHVKNNKSNYYSEGFSHINNKILLFDFKNKSIERYDIKNDKFEIIKNMQIEPITGAKIIPAKDGRVLIFGENVLDEKQFKAVKYGDMDNVYEYDDTKQTYKKVGKVFRRSNPIIKKINDNEIIILGGIVNCNGFSEPRVKEIEIYNIKTNTSKIVAKLPREITYYLKNLFDGDMIDKNHFIIIGGKQSINILPHYYKNALVLDLKTFKFHETANYPNIIIAPWVFAVKQGGVIILPRCYEEFAKKVIRFRTWGINNDQY